MIDNAISVKQLNLYVKSLLEGDKRLNRVTVVGELSNFKNQYSSGHWYFTLKDSDAAIRCVMFKSSANRVAFVPKDGDKVIINGNISLYEKDGTYQLYASDMAQFGEGESALQFKLIAEKLKNEGLFDESTKRPIFKFPKRIAVVTSATGAAVHDICTTLEKRMPSCEVVLCPVTVQGDTAAQSMIKTLDRIYDLNGIDTIIIGRGGGSSEDLSCFNDEMLARKVYESPVPVISAVGHEVDTTICDYVADARAATPTGAAVIATEDMSDYIDGIKQLRLRLLRQINAIIGNYELRYKAAAERGVLVNASEYIDRKMQTLDYLSKDLEGYMTAVLQDKEKNFCMLVSKLEALSPLKVLKRGFSVATGKNGAVLSVNEVDVGDKLSIRFSDGTVKCEVIEK